MTIETRYHGPTDTRGARISAKVPYGHTSRRYYYPYRHDLSSSQNHVEAAYQTAERLGMDDTQWHGGESSTGYVFVREGGPDFTIERDTNR